MCDRIQEEQGTSGKADGLRWLGTPTKRGGEDYPALPHSPLSVAQRRARADSHFLPVHRERRGSVALGAARTPTQMCGLQIALDADLVIRAPLIRLLAMRDSRRVGEE